MPQRIGFVILVTIPAIAFVEGIAAFCAGWLNDGGRIVMGMHRLVGLGDNRLLRPQAAGVVGKGQAGIGGLRGGFRLHQVPPLRPIHGPAGTVEVANGIAADRGAGDSAGGRVIGLPLIGNGLVIELGQQVLPAIVAVGMLNYFPIIFFSKIKKAFFAKPTACFLAIVSFFFSFNMIVFANYYPTQFTVYMISSPLILKFNKFIC